MKLVQINSVCYGSTGKIMKEIDKCAKLNGFDTMIFYGRGKIEYNKCMVRFTSKISFYFHVLFTFIFNKHGQYSTYATKKLIKKIKKFNPDIIQLHNIHGYYLNYNILFKYLNNEFKGKVYWTLHDCWSFTGHCAHYDYIKCDKWEKKCFDCPLIKNYPISLFFDTSSNEYELKKNLFTNCSKLELITPSKWLEKQVKNSFFNKKANVINNGIDLNVFRKVIDNSIYKKYNIDKNKKILLSVANVWTNRKGLDDIYKLSSLIPNSIQIVLVGLNKKQIKNLPKNIIGIKRTDNQLDLVKLYSISDLFINFTKEEVLGMVNIESIFCGTPVITLNTGGAPETIIGNVGKIVSNFDDMLNAIKEFINIDYKKNIFNNKKVLKKFDSTCCYKKYIDLYKEDK